MQAQEKLGPVDMLVNCAGTSISGKFEEMEVDRFKVGATECNPTQTCSEINKLLEYSHRSNLELTC